MDRNRIALLAVFAVLLSGCGTICNFAGGEPAPYGGVAKDLEVAEHSSGGGGIRSASSIVAVCALCAAEFCASAVADTLTLPFILIPAAMRTREAAADGRPLPPAQYSAGAAADPLQPRR